MHLYFLDDTVKFTNHSLALRISQIPGSIPVDQEWLLEFRFSWQLQFSLWMTRLGVGEHHPLGRSSCFISSLWNSLFLFGHSVVSYSFAAPWSLARQAPLSMGFPGQEYWSGLPFPSLRDLPNPGIETASPNSPAFQADSLLLNQLRNPGVPLILCILLL